MGRGAACLDSGTPLAEPEPEKIGKRSSCIANKPGGKGARREGRRHRPEPAAAGTRGNLTATVKLQLKAGSFGLGTCSELNDLIPLGL